MNNLKMVLKNISKRKGIYFLIMIQVMVSVWLLLTRIDAIEKINKIEKDVESAISKDSSRILRLTIIEEGTKPKDFLKFREEVLDKELLEYIAFNMYGSISIDEFCNNSKYKDMKNEFKEEIPMDDGNINTLGIENGIENLIKLNIVKGRNLNDEDFKWYEKGNTVPALGGYGLYRYGLIDIGDKLKDKYENIEYEIVGIIDEDDKWFFDNDMSNSEMRHLKDTLILPINSKESYGTVYVPTMHYFGEISGNKSSEEAIAELEKISKKHNVQIGFETLKRSIERGKEVVENEFKYYLIFSILFLIGTTFGITVMIVLLLNSRKHDIGVRIAVGASFKDIKRMISGEILFVNILSTLIVSTIYFIQEKILFVMDNEVVNMMDINLLTFISVIVGVAFMCILPIYIVTKRLSKFNPSELVGGRE
ncbi:ABC transporter permease [Anaerosalibacter bizertensis]|uniref:ABC transporter permease n=1 Tax=Anaerosalibacter bizertensis TaxID=932217 RepID=A0A9Q4ADU7_9FIRM|nr:ABC transporter permease [Anaerosalibacter bizertensis]MBV1818958.1 ABC transporter permease [Bacteroidales bacterium MSK.15.36]MBU5294209.1 ABC transporter permease [Anaerosalibacter bizertensis]MCB5559953.1 ABC transporter permease [Anaerosalibacter bizertensis]MCG4565796.1 ABC transporter permease [Anaerosalibacter bizertensis]MCG4583068.1 ABC transporter permease [Anaerosalibacter bizertensis]